MALVYWSFNGVMLPRYNQVADLGTPTYASSIQPTLGGLYDTIGAADRAMTQAHQFEMSGWLAGAGFNDIFEPGWLAVTNTAVGPYIVTGSQVNGRPILVISSDLQTEGEYALLAAQAGRRGTLVLRDPVGGSVQTRQARLLRVRRIQEHRHGTLLIECSCLFESLTPGWT